MTSPPGPTAAILIADDDALVRTALRIALVTAGNAVLEAADVPHIIALDAATPVQLAILDIHMPGGSVHDSLDALARRSPAPAVLLLSGNASPGTALTARVQGVARKPIELDDLRERVAALLAPGAESTP